MEIKMNPLSIGMLTGGASLLGSIFSSTTSASNTQAQIAAQQAMLGQTEQFNAGQAQVQRDYETQMSNTAYQRASKDMQAAGLNPMMMFGSGGASSTPSVGAASVGTPNAPMPQRTNPFAGIGDAVKAGLSSVIDAKSIDLLTQKIANMQSERAETEAHVSQRLQDIRRGTPSEIGADALSDQMRKHPGLVTAAEVMKYGAGAVAPAADVVGDVVGLGKGIFSSGKSGRFPTRQEDMSVGFDKSAIDAFRREGERRLYTLPQARQKFKDFESWNKNVDQIREDFEKSQR
jgi:hypothetical protein